MKRYCQNIVHSHRFFVYQSRFLMGKTVTHQEQHGELIYDVRTFCGYPWRVLLRYPWAYMRFMWLESSDWRRA